MSTALNKGFAISYHESKWADLLIWINHVTFTLLFIYINIGKIGPEYKFVKQWKLDCGEIGKWTWVYWEKRMNKN